MKDNQKLSRFELLVDNEIVFANYRLEENVVFIDHVEAPMSLRGSGAAGKLMEEIVEMAKKQNLKISPICGYAKVLLKRHKILL
jgi:predicted GNAT family acetyltransferase